LGVPSGGDIILLAMPIYEYKCGNDHVFEVMQRISDDPVTGCEVCGAPVERVFHPVAVHFKGSGFYNTDYGTRKRAREQKESADSGAKSDGASATDGAKSSTSSGSSDSKASSSTAAGTTSSSSSSD
jgi:putative FmdB family regulatory protein